MVRFFLLLVCLVLLTAIPESPGQCGGGVCAPSRVPIITTPSAIVTPGLTVAVPFALFQFVAPPTTVAVPAVAASQTAAPGASASDTRLDRIEAALASLAAARNGEAGGPPVVRRGTQRPPGTPVSVAAVAGLLQAKCAQCHTTPGRGDASLFNAAGVFEPNVSREEIYRSVKGDKMPRTPAKLSTEEKALLRAWADEEKDGVR